MKHLLTIGKGKPAKAACQTGKYNPVQTIGDGYNSPKSDIRDDS
jgi:hypothetical protein